MAFAPTKPWKLPFITTWGGSPNRNLPTNSAEEADILPLPSLTYTEPASGQVVRLSRRGLLCRASRRWHAVGGAGLDDSSRSRAREDRLRCAPAGSRAARIAPRHRDLPFLKCAQCARGGSRCRSPEQDANNNSSRNRPPFPPYDSHWRCKSSYARCWCSGCRHWPRGSTRRTTMNKITADHLARRACVYVRQSTPDQVQHNLESQRRQYALVDHARTLGWQDIDVIDDDLGISGCGTRRPGFERLLRALCDGQVGAVFSIEASRLARNGRDWHTLLEFCSIVGALLIDAEAVYDPRLTNDRLLLGMKGTISEMEVAGFRERAQAALMQKAQRGALIRRAAIGYVKGPDDRIEKDPDARVRSTLDVIFRKFAELGSVRQVYFWLDQQQIELPVARGPEEEREVVWLPARYHAVLSVLKNPVYAGVYAYGRSKTTVRLDAGQKQVRRQVRRCREDWAVLILDHHEGYIDWDVYQSNQTMIAHNDNARGNAVRGPIKHGEALLAGLLRCGHCGAKLLAQYPGPRVIRYQCSGYLLNRDHACCVMFGGLRADRLVSQQLMQSLAPFGIEAAIEARESRQGATDEGIQKKALALEHARYKVTRTRPKYDAVDPGACYFIPRVL